MKKRDKQKGKIIVRLCLAQSVAWFTVAAGRLRHLIALLIEGADGWVEVTEIAVSAVLFLTSGILSLINYKREKKKALAEQEPTEQENLEQA